MNALRTYISSHRRQAFLLGGAILIFFALLYGVAHDEHFYHSTIAAVIQVDERYWKTETGPNGESEQYYIQRLSLLIKNGPEEGHTAGAENSYSVSGVKSERYRKGDKVFVTLSSDGNTLTAEITGVKRDTYVALVTGLFLIGMITVAGKQGFFTLTAFCINIAVFVVSILFYLKGTDFIRLCLLMIFVFTLTTLFLSGGFSKKTLGAFLSTLLTLGVTYALYQLTVTYVETPPYHLMDYIFLPRDLDRIFLAGILIGCLGAVMDVAITVHSAVAELLRTSSGLAKKDLLHSMREIAHDVMGTMINVLLFSYISGSLPMIVLKVINGYPLYSMIRFNIIFELLRFLVGSIGIVLAIPVSGLTAVLLMNGRRKSPC